MAIYSIKQLEQLTGIKAHTLRMWEQRYALLCPSRTDTNIRFYSDCDLKKLLNIVALLDHGHRIGCVAKMPEQEMLSQIKLASNGSSSFGLQINRLVKAMIDMDEPLFEKIMSTNFLQHGFESTMIYLIYPFMQKVGVMWQTGGINPAREHFVSNLVRQKIIVAIDGHVVKPSAETKTYLLFLPEGENHELSLLFLHYMLKSRNNRVIYLGCSVPFEDIITIAETTHPDFLYTICTSKPCKKTVQTYIEKLGKRLPGQTILVSGKRVQCAKSVSEVPDNVQILGCLEDAVRFIDKNSSKAARNGKAIKA